MEKLGGAPGDGCRYSSAPKGGEKKKKKKKKGTRKKRRKKRRRNRRRRRKRRKEEVRVKQKERRKRKKEVSKQAREKERKKEAQKIPALGVGASESKPGMSDRPLASANAVQLVPQAGVSGLTYAIFNKKIIKIINK